MKRGNKYWIDVSFRRRRYRLPSPLNTYRGAKEYEVIIRQKILYGKPLIEPVPVVYPTFKEVALKWHESLTHNHYKPSEIEIRAYLLNARIFPFFGKKKVNEINRLDIEEYMASLSNRKLSPKTINNYLSIISCCFKAAVEWEIIKEYPRIKLLKTPPSSYDFLTENEVNQLLSYAYGLWYDMILLASKTGLRIGELLALQTPDINLEKRILTIQRNLVRGIEGSPKSNKFRTVPLCQSAFDVVAKRKHQTKYVFCHSDKRPLKYNYCQRHLQKICKRAGIRRIGWHTLRHTFATHLGEKGVSVIAIKELLGHADVKMTMRYTHPTLSALNEAIQIFDISNDTIRTQRNALETSKVQKVYAFPK